MKTSCLLITTNIKRRLGYLDDAIKSIYSCDNDTFDEKILSVDVFPNEPVPKQYFDKYKRNGWKVVFGEPVAGTNVAVYNRLRGINAVTGDQLLYLEDKVKITKIPDREMFCDILNIFDLVCYTTHIYWDYTAPPLKYLRYINNKSNYVHIGEELFFKKNEKFADEYYINFPVVLTTTSLYRDLLNLSLHKYTDNATEIGFTKGWMNDIDNRKSIGVYVNNDTFDYMPLNLMDFFHMANLKYWQNDPTMRPASVHAVADREDSVYLEKKSILETYEKKWLSK